MSECNMDKTAQTNDDPAKGCCGGTMGSSGIKEHMEVLASCGKHVGTVDGIEGESVKLTKSDPTAGNLHHFIPLEWVDHVDQHVHLKRNSEEVFGNWKAETASPMLAASG
jgi:hypothetical protein